MSKLVLLISLYKCKFKLSNIYLFYNDILLIYEVIVKYLKTTKLTIFFIF